MRPWVTGLANAAVWAGLQMLLAWGVTRMPASAFKHEPALLHVQPWEPRLYTRVLRVRSWKRLLPDGAAWVGGQFRKKRLQGSDAAYLDRFVLETRRGETAHWAMLACLPLFLPWNPRWAWGVNALYALVTNLPCIVVQRYNRRALQRRLARP